ncbi:MAG: insulinase family protein [Nanoarchaeota archaeon]|nr:insulinase family protein [Nanoarchaeota archaeon]
MDYSKFTLDNGTEIYVLQSPLWTHTQASVNFYSRNDAGNGAKALAAMLLMKGTKNHPTSQAINLAAEREYGASIGSSVDVIGDLHSTSFSFQVLTRDALTSGQKTLENMVALLSEVICEPLAREGKFNEEYFQRKKEGLLVGIRMQKMDKGKMAKEGFMKTAIGEGTPFTIPKAGDEEYVQALGNAGCFSAYERMCLESPRKVFACTSLEPERLVGVLAEALERMSPVYAEASISNPPEKNTGSIVEMKSPFDQSVAYAGFAVDMPEALRERQALQLANIYIGGSAMARLFTEIRTKRNMAYYAYSRLDPLAGILYGFSGIDAKNREAVFSIMADEITKARNGKISKKGFEIAKKLALSSCRMAMHTKESRITALASAVLLGRMDDLRDYENRFKDVTYEDVVRAGALIQPEPIKYCLLQKE